MTAQLWFDIMVGVLLVGAHMRMDDIEKRMDDIARRIWK